MTSDEYRMVRRLRAAKLTVHQIARKMGRCTTTISSAIKALGLPTDLRHDPNAKVPDADPKDAFAVRLFRLWADKALSMSDIAREMGLTHHQLHRAAKKYGLPHRLRQMAHLRDEPDEVTPEESDASAESLELSPYVQARIRELRIGYHDKVAS